MEWLYSTLAGRILRAPLKLVSSRAQIRIWSGPNRGLRWIAGSGYDAQWLGIFEQRKAAMIADCLRPGNVFWDVGAHAGYYSLLASPRVGEEGGVMAFEPLPINLTYLRRHIALNSLNNVRVHAAALGGQAGSARFEPGGTSFQGCLLPGGKLDVPLLAGDEEIKSGRIPAPSVIKMDIEGGEVEALPAMKHAVAGARALFISTHGEEARDMVHGLGGFVKIAPDEYMRRSPGQ